MLGPVTIIVLDASDKKALFACIHTRAASCEMFI